jgi:hypothetical protein
MGTLIYFAIGVTAGVVFRVTKTWTRVAVYMAAMSVVLFTINQLF